MNATPQQGSDSISNPDPEAPGNVNPEPEVLGGSSQDRTRRDPAEWVTGDDPATEAQKSYLDRLAREAGEEIPADGLTKAQASEHIDRLQAKTGMRPRQS